MYQKLIQDAPLSFLIFLKRKRKVASSKCLLKTSCFLKICFGSVVGDISPLSNSSFSFRCASEFEVHLLGSIGGMASTVSATGLV